MKILIAPDSFKGSLTSVAVARALGEGWRRARPEDVVRLSPLADGGEGTLDAAAAAGGWLDLPASARDPLGEPLAGRFLRQGDRAIIELATASGLSRLPADGLAPMEASTFGTGLILAAAVGLGAREIVLGLGGSATNDGGSGLLSALGVRFLDARGADVPPGGGGLAVLASVDLSDVPEVLREVTLTIASDVSNPLLGDRGAAATYGPQKGATEEQVAQLDRNLAHYADVLEAAIGRSIRDVLGAGAAGGTTAGLLAIADRFRDLRIRPGVEVMMELTGFAEALEACDLVLTGEGRIDEQTGYGKTALGVAQRAAAAGKPAIAFGGGVLLEGIAALEALGVVCVPVVERPVTVKEAMAAGPEPVARASERAARLLSMGEHG